MGGIHNDNSNYLIMWNNLSCCESIKISIKHFCSDINYEKYIRLQRDYDYNIWLIQERTAYIQREEMGINPGSTS